MKILILKPSSLGDVIHALPVLRLLKLHLPASEIYWWIDGSLTSLLENDPDLTGIFRFERKRWSAPHRWPEMFSSIRTMREMNFDVCIDLQGLARSAVFGWLSNAQFTIGIEGSREGAPAGCDFIAPRDLTKNHAVDRYVDILPVLNVPVHWRFNWLPRRADIAVQVVEKWQPGDARWILFCPGARWDNKRWPQGNFAALIRLLGQHPELKFGILGSRDDFELGRSLAEIDPLRCVNLAGQTSLPEMIEWIRLCQMVVTNDTGPMHAAAALGKPVVALFGPTDPRKTGPFRQENDVLQTRDLSCVPCMKGTCSNPIQLACLHAITPAMVYQQVREKMRL